MKIKYILWLLIIQYGVALDTQQSASPIISESKSTNNQNLENTLQTIAEKYIRLEKTFPNKKNEFSLFKIKFEELKDQTLNEENKKVFAQLFIDFYSLIGNMNFSLYMPEIVKIYNFTNEISYLIPTIKKMKVFNSNQTHKALLSLLKNKSSQN